MSPIKIFILSYNDANNLRFCISAIRNRTKYPHQIIVVDNASTTKETVIYLDEISRAQDIKVYRNQKNYWILGLNRPLREELRSDRDAYYVVTDCDVIPPIVDKEGRCWLSRMKSLMDENASVGKLGLALDLGYIKSRKEFEDTTRRETLIMQGPRMGAMIIAPVDTTLALYRYDLFVTGRPWFIPGHQSLYKPYYYCCRSSSNLYAKHLGWRKYRHETEESLRRKLFTFGLLGASIDPALKNKISVERWYLFLMLQKMARVYWGIGVCFHVLLYIILHFPRSLNQLQAKCRI